MFMLLQTVGGAANAVRALFEHVGIHHAGADVMATFEEAVAKEWRKLWNVAALLIVAASTARQITFAPGSDRDDGSPALLFARSATEHQPAATG
jgi:hypothetical protein